MTWSRGPVGKVIRSSQYGLSLPADPDGSFPIVGMKDIQNGVVTIDKKVRVKLDRTQATPYLLKDGDILLNRTNSPDLVGKAGIYRGTEEAVFASYLVRLELDAEQIDPDFLIQLLASEAGQRNIRQLATRAVSQANLNPTIFKQHFQIPVPSLHEQQRIRDIFRAWDKALENAQQLIWTKTNFKLALLRRLFGRNLWDAASHARSDELFSIVSERSRPDLPLLAVTQDRGVIPRSSLDRRILMDVSDPATFKIVRRNDFVISLRSFEGGLEHSMFDGIVSPAYTVLRCKERVNPRFYRHYLRSPDFLKRLSVAVIGIRDGKQISFGDFASIRLPLPAAEVQSLLADLFDECEVEIDMCRRYFEKLQMQKRGLMQKLLTGQWRVKIPDPEPA